MTRTTKAVGGPPAKDHKEAAERRSEAAHAPEPVDPRVRQLLDALENERRGYLTRGMTGRVAQVDEQIKKVKG